MGPDLNEKKEPIIDKILTTLCILWMFVLPCVMSILNDKLNVATVRFPDGEDIPVWALLWLAGIVFSGVYITKKGKKDRFNLVLNASFLQEWSLTDKNTSETHTGYLFVEGYDLVNRGTASAGSLAAWDDMAIKTRKQRNMEQAAVASAKDNVRKQNAKNISAWIHDEEVQQKLAEAVIRNESFPEGMNYLYFEKCRPLNKKYNGRYFAVPGYRGAETKIVVPLDCGFAEYIKEKNK